MFLQILREFLYTWEVRIGVILSMCIQIILVFFGSWRKTSLSPWITILVWCAYICADSVAIFSLGLLAQNRGGLKKEEALQDHQLHFLWVPFLILHLGGPDTITAYSLEDSKLWLRHLFNLIIQTGVASYAIVNSWNIHNPLTYLVVPIFMLGVVKYYERIWSLKSTSLQTLPGHSDAILLPSFVIGTHFLNFNLLFSFLNYKMGRAYGDELTSSMFASVFDLTCEGAFEEVENYLSLLYDVLYTKALFIYSRLGIFLRCVYLVSSVVTLASFVIIHKHNEAKWSNDPLSDILITYFLIIGAIALEIYAFFLAVASEWMTVLLGSIFGYNNAALLDFLDKICLAHGEQKKKWSRSIMQHSILKHRVLPKAIGGRRSKSIQDVFPFYFVSADVVPMSAEMKELVFEEMKSTRDNIEDKSKVRRHFEDSFGEVDKVLEKYGLAELHWRTTETEFDESLFIWHIATSLCYYSEYSMIGNTSSGDENNAGSNSKAETSRYISDYFMYLARFRSNMLPPGDYSELYDAVSGGMLDFFNKLDGNDYGRILQAGAYTDLLSEEPPMMTQGKRAAYLGIKLASSLREKSQEIDHWKMMSEVWAHMLLHAAASQHTWEEHAQQLRRGGEFITHVAFLLALASLKEEFKYSPILVHSFL